MQDQLVEETIHIAPGQLCVLNAQPGQSLHIIAGRVWLTEAGIPRDVILNAGARHTLRSAGKLLIESPGSARLRWHAAGAAAVLQAPGILTATGHSSHDGEARRGAVQDENCSRARCA